MQPGLEMMDETMGETMPMDLSVPWHSAATELPINLIKSEVPDYHDEDKIYTNLEPCRNAKQKSLITSSGMSDLQSWTRMHPENWTCKEVLEWMHDHVAMHDSKGGLDFKGEHFRSFTGIQLHHMSMKEFEEKEPRLGRELFCRFRELWDSANYIPPATADTEFDLDDCAFHDFEDSFSELPGFDKSASDSSLFCDDLAMYLEYEHVDLPQVPWNNDADNDGDSGISSDSDTGNNSPPHHTTLPPFHTIVPLPSMVSMQSDTPLNMTTPSHQHPAPSVAQTITKRPRGRPRKSAIVDSNGEPVKKASSQRGRKPGQSSKGNHLWEFIRDLLMNKKNEHLIKWENYKDGIFRIVRSEEVAKLWGERKNNPTMSYEKMSRAMRFCRTAGYFASVPKTGIYPKKLCFKFGQDSYGWRQDEIST